MFKIGCHLSASKGYLAMGKEAVSIGANTFQFFTRNPRGGKAKDIDPEDVKAFLDFSKEIREAVKILAESLEVPIAELSFLYSPIESWKI